MRAHLVDTADTAGRTAWQAFRELVLDDLFAGRLRFRDLSRPVRVAGGLGVLLVAMLALALGNADQLRASSPLLPGGPTPSGRLQLVPTVLVPLVLALLALSWSYLLAGAARARLLVRAPVAGLYLVTTASWLSASTTARVGLPRPGLLVLLLVTVVLVLVPAAHRRLSPVGSLVVVGALVVATYAISGLLATTTVLDVTNLPVFSLGLLLTSMRSIAIPLLVIAGLGMAVFAYQVATWFADAAGAARTRTPGLVLLVVLGLAALAGPVRLLATAALDQPLAALGGLGFVLVPGLCWAVLARHDDHLSEAEVVASAERVGVWLAIGFFGPILVTGLVLMLTNGISSILGLVQGVTVEAGVAGAADALVERLLSLQDPWRIVFDVAAVGAAVRMRGRRPTLAAYLLTFAAADLWRVGVDGSRFDWDTPEVVAGWLAIAAAGALLAGDRDRTRTRDVAVALGVACLFSQVDFLDSPFNPVLASSGVVFLVVAVTVGALTSGAWTNVGTVGLPRESRLFCYLGYTALSIGLLVWALASHDLETYDFYSGEAAVGGLRIFGDPLLIALLTNLALRPSTPVDEPVTAPTA